MKDAPRMWTIMKKAKTKNIFIIEGERCVRWVLEKMRFGFLMKKSNSIITAKRGVKTNAKLYILWKMSLGMLAKTSLNGM